jgi:hypothetical protein
MKLVLDSKWKWLAKDISGRWYFHVNKPIFNGVAWDSVGRFVPASAFLEGLDIEPKDSLHRVIDGEAIKYVDIPADGEPVMVAYSIDSQWYRKYSCGRLDTDGNLLCYLYGATNWSGKYSHKGSWSVWRRPTKEELE